MTDSSPLEALARITLDLEQLERLVAERVVALEETNTQLQAAREEAVRLSRLKDEFVAMASHELRTPLTAIKGFAVLLEDENTTMEEVRDAARIISAQTDRLIRILDDMLDIARIESGTLPVNLGSLHVAEVFDRAVETVRKKHGDRPVQLDGGDFTLVSDGDKLEQIFLNLLDNACKYGGAEAVSVVARSEDGGLVAQFHNAGPGITPAEQEALFEKFRRLDRTRGEREGTGLGLYITRSLVELLGGTIGVESAPGQGVTFQIALPDLADSLGDG